MLASAGGYSVCFSNPLIYLGKEPAVSSEIPLKPLPIQAEFDPATSVRILPPRAPKPTSPVARGVNGASNGHHQRMSVSVVAPPRNHFRYTHSSSRCNRRDGSSLSEESGTGRRTGPAACSITRTGGCPLPEKLLSRALSTKEWGTRIYVEETSFDIFSTNLGSGVRISSCAPSKHASKAQ